MLFHSSTFFAAAMLVVAVVTSPMLATPVPDDPPAAAAATPAATTPAATPAATPLAGNVIAAKTPPDGIKDTPWGWLPTCKEATLSMYPTTAVSTDLTMENIYALITPVRPGTPMNPGGIMEWFTPDARVVYAGGFHYGVGTVTILTGKQGSGRSLWRTFNLCVCDDGTLHGRQTSYVDTSFDISGAFAGDGYSKLLSKTPPAPAPAPVY